VKQARETDPAGGSPSWRHRHFIILAALALVLAVAISACGGGGSSSSSGSTEATTEESGGEETAGGEEESSGETLKVGNISSITGLGGTFDPYPAGAKAYFEFRNKEGGIAGHQIEYIEKDDAADPSTNAQEARELIGDGIVATVADANVGTAGGGAPVLQEAGIAAVGGNANGPEWFGEFDNLFALVVGAAAPEKCVPRGPANAIDNGMKKLAIVAYNFPAGETDAECLEAGIKELGGTLAEEAQYQEPGQPELRPLVQKIVASGAEGVLLETSSVDMINFIKTADQLGYKGNIVGGNGMAPEVLEGIGPIAEEWDGRIFGQAFALSPGEPELNPELETFQEYIPTKYKENFLATAGWSAGMMFANAVEEGGDTSEEILEYMKNLEGFDAEGMIPEVHYAKGLNPTECNVQVVNEGNKRFIRAPKSPKEGFSCTPMIDATK
jgi:branched-chain amino acid transport system substrate-binding protein